MNTKDSNLAGVQKRSQKQDIKGFLGEDYDEARDFERLSKQHDRIFSLMSDGQWRTLGEIEEITKDPQASISAQLRCFRRKEFGAHTVQKEYIQNGLYRYRLILNRPTRLPPVGGV